MKELHLKNGRALVIVAHPDDETIWMGGTMLSFPKIRWTVFSLCRKNDSDRAPKFRKAAKQYGARPIISDLEDEGIMTTKQSLPEIEKRIEKTLKNLEKSRFNYVFTHGKNGEYGHPRHQETHRTVKKLLRGKTIAAEKVFCFSYEKPERKNFCLPSKQADLFAKLSPTILKRKKFITEKIYGFPKSSFEYKSSSPVETFRVINKI
ncbi:PIG-L family deacetylase [Candidatus Wolfebacteria bacterium]|nr:PIG-L family deacetylase [Candidatus Wolfebacteria bacterium]